MAQACVYLYTFKLVHQLLIERIKRSAAAHQPTSKSNMSVENIYFQQVYVLFLIKSYRSSSVPNIAVEHAVAYLLCKNMYGDKSGIV